MTQEEIPQETIEKDFEKDTNVQVIEYKDASSAIAEKLPEQLGSDPTFIAKGKFDERKLSNIDEIDRLWLSYFLLIPDEDGGNYARNLCDNYLTLSDSIGGERAKDLIRMQLAASGIKKRKEEDKRNFLEKHLTQRGKEPKDSDIDE